MDELRGLVNTFSDYGVLRWSDGTPAAVTASFDSDGEQTNTDFINISVLLPVKNLIGRFGVFVTIVIADVDDLAPEGPRTATA